MVPFWHRGLHRAGHYCGRAGRRPLHRRRHDADRPSARNEQYDPDYLKLKPAGVVPTLVHNGEPVIKSTLICEFLEETFPEPRLVPTDPGLRMRMRLWTKAADEGLHEA